jgi:hypothetical protein
MPLWPTVVGGTGVPPPILPEIVMGPHATDLYMRDHLAVVGS